MLKINFPPSLDVNPGKYVIKNIIAETRSLSLLFIKYFIPLLLLFTFNVSPTFAQGSFFWSEQEKIPEYLIETEEPPYLIADMNRTVHAFNSQPLNLDDQEAPHAVFYRQWTPTNGWTFPNDILYDVSGQSLNVLGVTSDQTGRVHLILLKNGDVYYTQNYLTNAGNAITWPRPLYIADAISSYGPGNEIVGAISTNPEGNEIVVIYAGQHDGNGLYYTQSSDGGSSWSNPYPLYLTGDSSIVVTDPKLFTGESGIFHAVWTTFLEDGSGGPGFYANFDPETKLWSEPVELDTPGIRTPSVIEIGGDVFVSYYHSNVNGNWWKKSKDNGKTWSLPEQISPRHMGTNGSVSFAVDSRNVLHAFFGERIDDNNHGIWHTTFTGATWVDPETVVRGPQRRERIGGNGFDPRSARAVIVNGNIALVTWGTDGFAGTNGAWYSSKNLEAPELPPVVLDSPTAVVPLATAKLVTDALVATASPTPLSEDMANLFAETPGLKQDPQASVFVGIITILLLLGVMVVVYYSVARRK